MFALRALFAFGVVLAAAGCGPEAVYANSEGTAICPVTGYEIPNTETAIGHQDLDGVRYYFCCSSCPESFEKDPEMHLEKRAEEEGGN